MSLDALQPNRTSDTPSNRGPVSASSPVHGLPGTAHLPALPMRALRGWRGVGRVAFGALWNIRTHLHHNLPDGPAIIAPNHTAAIDGPLIVLASPDTFALAKSELFSSPVAPLLRVAGQIPLERTFPDVDGLRRAVHVLRSGRKLAIFPEGRRGSGDFTQFRGGVAWLALVTGVPVVPVAILGTKPSGTDLNAVPRLRATIDVVFGGARHYAEAAWPRTSDEVSRVRDELQTACVEHLAFAQRLVGRAL